MKKIISAVLAGAMILSSVPAMANDINITIDNSEFIPKNALGEVVEPFIENGSTYLPVRAMGEAVGKSVSFDAENYAVYIGAEPSDEEKVREPLLLLDDSIVYKDEIEYEFIDNVIHMAKVIKLAESKFTKEEIAQCYSEHLEWWNEEDIEEYERVIYYSACSELLNLDIPEGCADKEKYVTVQHILVKDEEVAFKVIDELNGGAAFEAMIEEYNTDPGQKSDSTYTFTFGEMVEEFEIAAFALDVEKYTTEPVASDYGYHIIFRLPLDEYIADAHYYQRNILSAEIENTECKVVRVEKTGVYGKIEGYEMTAEVLEALSDEAAEEVFGALEAMAIVRTIMEQNNLFVEEREAYKSELAVMLEIALDSKTDEKTLNYITDLFAAFLVYMETFSYGNVVDISVAELFENEENYPEIESEIYRDVKVFVDGKLIVPSDVNNNYVAPKNVDGTVYVPVRAIVEALGMKADWNNDSRTVVITK